MKMATKMHKEHKKNQLLRILRLFAALDSKQ